LAVKKKGFTTIGFLLDDQAPRIKSELRISDAEVEAHLPSVIKRRCR